MKTKTTKVVDVTDWKSKAEERKKHLQWALEIIDTYDVKLAERGEEDLVYSSSHLRAKQQARNALSDL